MAGEKSPLLRRVDIQTAASRIAGVNGKRFRLAETENIVKDALDALLMEFVMVAERDQIAQELLAVDFRPTILDLHRAPVRLVGDQAVGLQQVADQRLFHDFAAGGALQVVGAELIVIDLDILIVDAGAVEVSNRLAFQFIQPIQRDLDLATGAGAQIAGQRLFNLLPAGETRLVKAVEIKLKAFDSTRLTLVSGSSTWPTATCGRPLPFSRESSYSVQISAP